MSSKISWNQKVKFKTFRKCLIPKATAGADTTIRRVLIGLVDQSHWFPIVVAAAGIVCRKALYEFCEQTRVLTKTSRQIVNLKPCKDNFTIKSITVRASMFDRNKLWKLSYHNGTRFREQEPSYLHIDRLTDLQKPLGNSRHRNPLGDILKLKPLAQRF